jgi:thioredoxin-related protein
MHHQLVSFATDITDSDWNQVLEKNDNGGKPELVLFATTYCPVCTRLENNVLSRPDVRDELKSHYVFYTVDLSSETQEIHDRTEKLGIPYVPVMIRYDAFGRETARASYMDADEMIDWLKAGE